MAGERNKVVIPLNERLIKAKLALRQHEERLTQLFEAYGKRNDDNDTEVLDEIGAILRDEK